MPNRNEKIAILGAGPAGISMAMHLKEKGYQHVTLFEKEDHVGGKALSENYKGKKYSLGANLVTPRYKNILALADKLKMKRKDLGPRRILNLSEKEQLSLKNAPFFVKWLAILFMRYFLFNRSLTGVDKQGFGKFGGVLSQTFGKWLNHRGMSLSKKIFANTFVAYGYGPILDLPAAYALKFLDKVHGMTTLKVALGLHPKGTQEFVEGYQELFSRAVTHFDLDVKLSVNIERIVRSKSVTIQYEQKGKKRTETFDRLVIACPYNATAEFMDLRPKEAKLFKKISTYRYFVVMAVVKGLDKTPTYLQPYAYEFSPGFPMLYYFPQGGDVCVMYVYGDEKTGKDLLKKRIREVLAHPKLRGRVEKFIKIQDWTYFPHVSSKDMQAGFYRDLESLQGANRTYYIGETLAFPLIELIDSYSKYTVDRFFEL